MHLRSWTFRVEAAVGQGQVVGVTGNVPQLGDWKVEPSSTIVLLSKDTDSESNLWTVTTWLPDSVDIEYRYYIAILVEDRVVISQREVSILPRVITKDVLSNTDGQKTWDEFGCTAGGTGPTQVDRGWLTSETVVQFKLHSNPITFWKEKQRRRRPFVKVTPLNISNRSEAVDVGDMLENSLSLDTLETHNPPEAWPITEVADLNDPEGALSPQQQFGQSLGPDDFLLFQVQVNKPDEMAYLVDIYMENPRASENDPPEHIGFAYVLASVMRSSEGHLLVPITSTRHRPIGQLSIYYLIILPTNSFICDLSVSYSKYWKHSGSLDVGHRGLGTSFKQKSCAEVRENTIASLKEAASHGADFVEFDVQLSKDMVPVIYHDFHVCISLKRKRVEQGDMLEFPIKELTLNQLQCLKDIDPKKPRKVLFYRGPSKARKWLYHIQEGKVNQQLLFDEDLEEHEPFPTLEQALKVIDPAVGFNIEIKWTMLLKDGTMELNNPFDLNIYLDSVLKVVLEHGGSRKIVFSCFHPDICTMVKYKQARYPVVFLTQGVTSKYPMYHDPRCHTIPAAVRFARCLGMLGINVHTEDILRDAGQVEFVKSNGLVLFCWGDDNNDPQNIDYLKKLGLNAIIYDKIDQFGPKRRMVNTVFVSEGKEHQQELLEMSKSSDSNLSPATPEVTNQPTQPSTHPPHPLASWLVPPQHS